MRLPRPIRWARAKLDSIFVTILIIFWFVLFEPITKQANKMKLFKDMDDNQFWITLWSFAATAVLALIALIAYNSAVENKLMEQMINQGHDPIELSCLFNSGSESTKAPCLLLAQAKAKILLEQNNVTE